MRRRILIIDDEKLLLAAYRRMLSAHDVVVAVGGREALSLLDTDRAFDLVLCDLMMPDVDGKQVYEFICSEAPELRSRLAFHTGGAASQVLRNFSEWTDIPILHKPLLPDAIDRLLE